MTQDYNTDYDLYDMAHRESDNGGIETQSEALERESRRYSRRLEEAEAVL